MVHGLAGDDKRRAEWLDIVDALGVSAVRLSGYGATFDAVVLLHRGRASEAVDRLAAPPEGLRHWITGLWRQWYGALWAEASVMAALPDAGERLDRARRIVSGNPIATAIVDRAAALAVGDRAGLLAAAAALDAAGCRYQRDRSLVLAGGEHRDRGEALLDAAGAMPMVSPDLPRDVNLAE
jgi:hypothetical protein